MADDPLGIARETIIARSGVREVFTPHQPILEQKLLRGRAEEVRSLLGHLRTPGQHALLFGDRGVGKSSLANVVRDIYIAMGGGKGWTKRCDSEDTFATVVGPVLSEVGAELPLAEAEQEKGRSGGISAKGIKLSRDRKDRRTYTAVGGLTPSFVAEQVGGLNGLLVIDEADAIANADDRRRLAELVKHLSDSGSRLKVLIVGIAATGADLTAAHPSAHRCLQETPLRSMSEEELEEIVEEGGEILGLEFEPEAIDAIVSLSSGFPHFTHLLALQCAEDAIVERRTAITREHVRASLASAAQRAEGSLGRAYKAAVRSFDTDNYRLILQAAATLDTVEFRSIDLRDAYASLTGETITQGSVNNYLQRLVSEDGSTVLRRLKKGIYRFEDPRMPGYVRIANEMLPN